MFKLINYTNSYHPLYGACFDAASEGAAAAAEAARVAAEAAAAKAASDKVAADKAAADKVIADKAAADAERIRKSGMSDADAALLKENMGQKKKLEAAATEAAELKAKLAAFDGVDLEAVKKMIADKAEADKKTALAAGDFERVLKMTADENAKLLAAAKKEADDAKAEAAKIKADNNDLTIGSAFNVSKFIADELVLPAGKARAIFGSHFELDGGKIVAFDKPTGATERTKLVDGSGSPVDFETAIKKLVEADSDRDRLLKSKLAAGAGSRTENNGRKTVQNTGEVTGQARILAALQANKMGVAKK